MNLLNIFHTGGLTLGLSLVALALVGWFGYQAYKAHGSGGKQQGPVGYGQIYDNKKTPYKKIPQFWMAIAVVVLYIVAMLIVASDYRGV